MTSRPVTKANSRQSAITDDLAVNRTSRAISRKGLVWHGSVAQDDEWTEPLLPGESRNIVKLPVVEPSRIAHSHTSCGGWTLPFVPRIAYRLSEHSRTATWLRSLQP